MQRIRILITLTILLSFLAAGNSYAQSLWNGGSAFSSVSYGMPNDFRAEFANAMGVYGVALHDIRHSNTANPALWGHATFANFSGGFFVNSFEINEGGDTNWNNILAPTQFQAVLPIVRDKFGVSASLIPLTRAGYSLNGAPQFLDNGTEYSISQQGSGTLSALELGFGWRITNVISVGYAPSFVFGSYNVISDVSFNSTDYLSDSFRTNTSHTGFRNRAGVFLNVPGFHGSGSRLGLGATMTLPVTLQVERERKTTVGTREITISPRENFDLEGKLPAEVAVGFSYQFDNIWAVSSDVLYQNWSDAVSVDPHSLYDVSDRIRVGAGVRINASRALGEPQFRNRFNYRFGASYDSGYLVKDDTNIATFLVSAGLGIPSRRSGSSVNINVEAGTRGGSDSSIITERIYGVSLTFSLSELMFYRPRLQ